MDTRQILIDIYTNLGGQYWKQDTNWNTPSPLNTWYGVVVNENNSLIELNLEDNNLEGTLPSSITLCSNLKRLNMRGNKLTGPLPEGIGRCTSLRDLGLSRNILTGTIPESLGQCANLEYIGLSNNRLIDNIPESLGRCTKLREVSLGHNKLTGSIPESLGRCVGLTTLSLSDNRLSGELPECLEKWVNLQKLLLDNNQFSGPLPNSIGKCVNLRQLSIADNELSGFFPEALGKCVNLRRLNLSGNSISGRIPDTFGQCNQLDHLYLLGNRLVGYEIIRKLFRLKVLDIDLVTLLDLPNELQGRELQIILSYIRELHLANTTISDKDEDGSSILMKRIKIMLLGPGEAGKTTLLHRLIHGKFEGGYGMTDGILMSELVLDDLKINFWDFSGQNIYMNTHLLFFSAETLYFVIWNPRQHDNHSFVSIYLNMIRNYSPKAPVILITTHAKDTSRISDYTYQILENKFSSNTIDGVPSYGPICCYHHVDSQTGVGIQELKKDILKFALQQPWVIQRVPKIYKKLEIGLKELGNHGRFSLTKNEYLKYCNEVFRIDEENSLYSLQLFHSWGVIHILYLGDIIIEPQKLALVMSSAISYKAEIIYRMGDGKLGLLRHDEIDIVWKEFDDSLRPQFLQMFHDYKLAYPLYDSRGQPLNASIVPAMLPDEPLGGGLSPTEDDLKNLYFPLNCKKQASVRLECDYLPVALIPKIQVRLSLLATLGGAWKYGCSLQIDSFNRYSEYTMTQSYAIIQSNPYTNTIDIYSGGDTTAARTIAIKCLIELQKESFSTMEFTDIKLYYNSEPIAAKKLIERKLKKDFYSYIIYEGDNEDAAIPLRGLALLFPTCYPERYLMNKKVLEEEIQREQTLRLYKIHLIHEEMINMYKNRSTPSHLLNSENNNNINNNNNNQTTITNNINSSNSDTPPIIDLLIKKKKLRKQQQHMMNQQLKLRNNNSNNSNNGNNNKLLSLKDNKNKINTTTNNNNNGNGNNNNQTLISSSSNVGSLLTEYTDYRHIISTKLLTLEQMALQVLSNPETIEELIDLENMFLDCYDDILLYGCNIPSDLFEVHTLWIAYGDGKNVLPITPPEKPTNPWSVVSQCSLPIIPRQDRSTLPGINKYVSEIVLLVLKALGIECIPPISSIKSTGLSSIKDENNNNNNNNNNQIEGKSKKSVINPLFTLSSNWVGLVDLSPFIDSIKTMELKYFLSIENSLGKQVWVEKGVAGRMHAPNMSVSDQVFRELFKGTRGANPHATLLRDAIDNITPISLGILPKYDIFISHSASSNDHLMAILLRDYFNSRGLSVWIDLKKKTGINKGMMSAIDSSSYFIFIVSKDYIDNIYQMEQQIDDPHESIESTNYFQLLYVLKRKDKKRIIPLVVEETLMKGWNIEIPHTIIVEILRKNLYHNESDDNDNDNGNESNLQLINNNNNNNNNNLQELNQFPEQQSEQSLPVQNSNSNHLNENVNTNVNAILNDGDGDNNDENDDENELHIDEKEYNKIKLELMRQQQIEIGWIGIVGNYLFEYDQLIDKVLLFVSNQLVHEIKLIYDQKLLEEQRLKEEEELHQQQLLKKKRNKLKHEKSIELPVKAIQKLNTSDDLQQILNSIQNIENMQGTQKSFSQIVLNPIENSKVIQTQESLNQEKKVNESKDGNNDSNKNNNIIKDENSNEGEENQIDGKTSVEKTSEIEQNIQKNLVLQILLQFSRKSESDLLPNSSELLMKVNQQLYECHQLIFDIIQNPVSILKDIWFNQVIESSSELSKSGSPSESPRIFDGNNDNEDNNNDNNNNNSNQNNNEKLNSLPENSSIILPNSFKVSNSSFLPQFQSILPLNSDYKLKYKYLIDLTLDDVSNLFHSLHFTQYISSILTYEITGMTLYHCQTTSDLKELGIKSEIKGRELLTYLHQMRLCGVPVQYLQKRE